MSATRTKPSAPELVSIRAHGFEYYGKRGLEGAQIRLPSNVLNTRIPSERPTNIKSRSMLLLSQPFICTSPIFCPP
jgi:hypothetical protein